jgi:hypothetical protein
VSQKIAKICDYPSTLGCLKNLVLTYFFFILKI